MKYNLIVLHGKKKSDLNQIEKDYSVHVHPYYFLNGRFVFLNVFSALRKFRPQVIIHQGSPGILSLPLTWLWCKLNNTRFALWTHGFERHQGFRPDRSFRSLLRLAYFKMADGVLFYTKERKDFFKDKLPAHKLFYATNTLDTTSLMKLRDQFVMSDVESLKKDLKMNGHFNMVFIGRLLKDKLADHLILITWRLKNKGVNARAHIIGGGEEQVSLKKMADDLGLSEEVIFYGPVFDDAESGKILFSSDVMVMPGYIGLAINHAYCFDLPVVTYQQSANGPFHSPEIDFLENGKTGIMTESNNIDAMTNALLDLAQDPDLLRSYKENVRRKVEDLRIEKMEEGFSECIEYLATKRK